MVKWVCVGCNYRFDSQDATECPYCGRRDKLEKEPSAEELLTQVEKILGR